MRGSCELLRHHTGRSDRAPTAGRRSDPDTASRCAVGSLSIRPDDDGASPGLWIAGNAPTIAAGVGISIEAQEVGPYGAHSECQPGHVDQLGLEAPGSPPLVLVADESGILTTPDSEYDVWNFRSHAEPVDCDGGGPPGRYDWLIQAR